MLKKLCCLCVCLLLIVSVDCSKASNEVSLPEINLEMTVPGSWLYVDRNTRLSDLIGTEYNNDVFRQAVQQVQQILYMEEYKDIHAYLIYMDDGILLECAIITSENEESRAVWDISTQRMHVPDDESFKGYYTSRSGDLYQCMDLSELLYEDYEEIYLYTTINNGRTVSLRVASAYPISDSTIRRMATELLDGISFTDKSSKPAWIKASEWLKNTIAYLVNRELTYFVYGIILLCVGAVIALVCKVFSLLIHRR